MVTLPLAIVLSLSALAYGRPSKPEGSPLVGKVLGFCLKLAEEAIDDPEKRSWDDVFGALTPVCEDLLNMAGPEQGSGDGRKPRPDSEGSGKPAPEIKREKKKEGPGGKGNGDEDKMKPEGSGGKRKGDEDKMKPEGSGKKDGSGDRKPGMPKNMLEEDLARALKDFEIYAEERKMKEGPGGKGKDGEDKMKPEGSGGKGKGGEDKMKPEGSGKKDGSGGRKPGMPKNKLDEDLARALKDLEIYAASEEALEERKMKEGPGDKGKGGEDKMKPEGSGGKGKGGEDKMKPEGSGRKDGSGGRKPGMPKNKVEEDLARALKNFEIYADERKMKSGPGSKGKGGEDKMKPEGSGGKNKGGEDKMKPEGSGRKDGSGGRKPGMPKNKLEGDLTRALLDLEIYAASEEALEERKMKSEPGSKGKGGEDKMKPEGSGSKNKGGEDKMKPEGSGRKNGSGGRKPGMPKSKLEEDLARALNHFEEALEERKMKEGPSGKGKGGEDKMKPEGSGGQNKGGDNKMKPEGSGRKDGSGGRKPGMPKNKLEEDLARALKDFEIYAASEEALEERKLKEGPGDKGKGGEDKMKPEGSGGKNKDDQDKLKPEGSGRKDGSGGRKPGMPKNKIEEDLARALNDLEIYAASEEALEERKMKEGPGGKGKGGEDTMKPEGSGGKNKGGQDKMKPEGSGRKDGSGGRKPGMAKNKLEEDLARALLDLEIYAASEEALEERKMKEGPGGKGKGGEDKMKPEGSGGKNKGDQDKMKPEGSGRKDGSGGRKPGMPKNKVEEDLESYAAPSEAPEERRMKKGPGGKSKGGEGKMKPEGSDKENGSGDRKSEKPENKVEAFLDICESLLELEKEALEQRENDLTLEVVAGMMKEYCEQAFALAKDEEKKR